MWSSGQIWLRCVCSLLLHIFINGQGLLLNLEKLKAALVEPYERYTRSGAVNAEAYRRLRLQRQAQAGVSLFSSSVVLTLHPFDNPTATRFPPSHILSLLQLSSLCPHPHLPVPFLFSFALEYFRFRHSPACPKCATAAAAPRAQRSQALHTAAQKATADELERWRAQREEAAAKDAAVGYTRPAPGAEYGGGSSEYRSSASSAARAYAAGSRSAYEGSQSSSYGGGPSYGAGGAGSAYGAGGSQPQPTYLSSASQAAVPPVVRAAGVPAPVILAASTSAAAAADGTRPRVFLAFQFWGRRAHVSKQRGGIVPAAGARDVHQYQHESRSSCQLGAKLQLAQQHLEPRELCGAVGEFKLWRI
ncbi:hypothetical protein B0H10DRAFT_1041216 [Mycena sp. CBHHK59/15]|nr:hypothetical protein B0H10DRAFT_1041216 [Mycena sp. CBHHK59/15]